MNTHELIESTMLHAMGLLDDTEREAYEAAFDAAPATVQARVRTEARRMADLGDLLPETEPSENLRSMVLSAVRAAMREDENETRIAQGTNLPASQPMAVVGRITPNATQAPIQHASTQRATSQPKLSSSPRVNKIWRVAAISCAAASITLGVITVNMQQAFDQAHSRALVTSLYDTVEAPYLEATLLGANTRRVVLVSQTEASESTINPGAAVWTNPDWNTARLYIKNLTSENNQPYRLVVLDSEGNIVREITTFSSTGELQKFDVDVNLATERNLAIYPAMIEDIENASPVLLSAEGTL